MTIQFEVDTNFEMSIEQIVVELLKTEEKMNQSCRLRFHLEGLTIEDIRRFVDERRRVHVREM